MPYPNLIDHRMPYHRDGTVIGYAHGGNGGLSFAGGLTGYLSSSDLNIFNGYSWGFLSGLGGGMQSTDYGARFYLFFPEMREVTGYVVMMRRSKTSDSVNSYAIEGSVDSTNGLDGTWEAASLPGGTAWAWYDVAIDGWRTAPKPVSFTGTKRVVRMRVNVTGVFDQAAFVGLHLYGEKAAGQTPDDIVFIDPATNAEFAGPIDFGDRPLGTTETKTFKLKNTSTTKTATGINIQCNDTDFAISDDGTTWGPTLNLSSLAAGAMSPVLSVRCTTPNPGALLGPRFAEIVVTVNSWT